MTARRTRRAPEPPPAPPQVVTMTGPGGVCVTVPQEMVDQLRRIGYQ